MKRSLSLGAALCAAVLFTPVSHAQRTNLYVGSNSSGVTTNINNSITNYVLNTFVGYDPGADSNTLNVLNTNTWLTNSALYVGYEGSSNSLVISNGGKVGGYEGHIGYTTTSSNNSVLVTGTNSLWTNQTMLYIGFDGSGNNLVISNGGAVWSAVGTIGSLSSNNRLLVTGTNSAWNDSGLYVGEFGSGNSLVISDGGRVTGGGGGQIGLESDSSNNSVLVTGANSLWTNSRGLYVGVRGSSNSLVISNGGRAASTAGNIGVYSNSTHNSVLVTGTNSTWTNSGGLYVGFEGSSHNSLVISNGGTVAVASNIYSNSYIGYTDTTYDGAASNNSVLVTGTNSTWTNRAALYVGYEGSSNSLVISNGGTVRNTSGTIGSRPNAEKNSVLVTGSGSLWTNSSTLIVSDSGSSTSLTIADGGTVAASGITIAARYGSSGTLNIGRFGTNDTGGTIIAPTIAFGTPSGNTGTGAINFNQSDAVTITSVISGAGTLNQRGSGTTILSGGSANTYSGTTTVSGGTLNLNKTPGVEAIVGAVAVNSGAILLLSSSNQVKNTATVTLSGGTITRGSGVSEVFGNLNLTQASFLDFGTGTAGTISFGTYTPSSLLTINNFGLGNTLVFGSDLRSTINNSSFFSFTNGGIASSSWDEGAGTFTITAIPEPSTYVVTLGLLALLLWPLRRHTQLGSHLDI